MASYDPNNVFAKILRGELPSHKVYEDDRAFAFLDIMPRAPGHTLVVPKAPARNILDVDPDDLAHLARIVQNIARAGVKVFGADGVTVHHVADGVVKETWRAFHRERAVLRPHHELQVEHADETTVDQAHELEKCVPRHLVAGILDDKIADRAEYVSVAPCCHCPEPPRSVGRFAQYGFLSAPYRSFGGLSLTTGEQTTIGAKSGLPL